MSVGGELGYPGGLWLNALVFVFELVYPWLARNPTYVIDRGHILWGTNIVLDMGNEYRARCQGLGFGSTKALATQNMLIDS